jgi:hypothetical protein
LDAVFDIAAPEDMINNVLSAVAVRLYSQSSIVEVQKISSCERKG